MKALELHNLSYWHSRSEKPTLRNINLDIARGEFVAILGASSSGKTTLCLAMAGALYHLYGGQLIGSVTIHGEDTRTLSLPEIAKKVGVVFENPEIMFCNLRVKEEVAFGLENLSIVPPQMEKMVRVALEAVGLDGFQERFIYELSGGEQQRLAIACALAADPPILILDEPTSSIDPAGRDELFALLQKLRSKGKTIIVTSKEWDQYVTESDTVIVLANGEIRCKSSPYLVIDNTDCRLEEVGIFLPEVTEVAIELRKRGFPMRSLPLTIKEASDLIQSLGLQYTNHVPSNAAANMEAEPALKLSNVTFTYPNGLVAVRDVEMCVPAGSICALVGNNGAGKTTLAKLIVGLLRPQSGIISVLGKEVQSLPRRLISPGVTYVFQNPLHQFLTDSIYDEVGLGLRIRGHLKGSIEASVTPLIERCGLWEIRSAHPLTVSAAQQRMVAIASALVLSPKVLILDEPTHGQDRFTIEKLQRLFSNLKAQGSTLIVITHDVRFMEAYADIVYVMSQGALLFTGTPSELVGKHEVIEESALKPTQLAQLVQAVTQTSQDKLTYPRTPAEFVTRLAVKV